MRTMLISDFIVMRKNILQLLGICVIVGLVIAYGMGSLIVATTCISSMVPFMYLFNVTAYDELGDWQSFRLTLPLSRRETVLGRYLGVLLVLAVSAAFSVIVSLAFGTIVDALSLPADLTKSLGLSSNPLGTIAVAGLVGTLCVLVVATVMLPLVARWGLTRGTRWIPVAIVLAIPLSMWILKLEPVRNAIKPLADTVASGGISDFTVVAILVGAALVLYVASMFIAGRLYETREL